MIDFLAGMAIGALIVHVVLRARHAAAERELSRAILEVTRMQQAVEREWQDRVRVVEGRWN